MNASAHLDIVAHDLRYAVRTLRRAPFYTVTVVLIIALGIGANTAAFSVADFVLFRPLPFPDADALVRVCEGPRTGGGWGCNNEMSPANYRDLAAMSSSFSSIGAFANDAVNLVGGGEPRRLPVTALTAEVLPLLGVPPLLGRGFEAGNPDDANAVVISYGLWQTQFGGAPGVSGQRVSLNGAPHTVIGVMPPTFYFPTRDVQLWRLLAFTEDDLSNRANNYIQAVGRLKPGVTFDHARAEMIALAERLSRAYPETNADTGVSFFRMRDTMAPRFRVMLLSLIGASLCLLLLTCANLANLMLARATAQGREMAVRAALGAATSRLVRQLITQSVVLVLLGGILGLLIAVLVVPLFASLVPTTLPLASQPTLDMRVLLIAVAFTSLTALGFGLIPAARVGRADFAALREGDRAGGGRKQHLRAALVTVEVAMTVVLLITSGLLIRAVWRVQSVDPGFASQYVLTMRTALPRPKYVSPVRRTDYYAQVLREVRALPGVEQAAFTSGLPMVVTGLITGVEIPGRENISARAGGVSHRWVTSNYFRAMGIPLLRGRDIEDGDTADRQWVAVVSQSFADRYWPGEDSVGHVIVHRGRPRTIVGVVGDVRVRGLERTSEPQLYLPAEQIPEGFPANFDPKDLVIRHTGRTDTLVSAVRQIIHKVDPDQPISDVRTLDAVLAGETAPRDAQVQVLGVLAAVAVVLAAVGIYGLLSYTVSQRSREIGVRLALGAEPRQVGRMIFADGLRVGLIGIVPGALIAFGAARALRALLFGVAPSDPLTFTVAIAAALVITFAGALVPAVRALRVNPIAVLRAE